MCPHTAEQLGAAADAIALAEEKLAGQNSLTAVVDIQLVSAVVNAHLTSIQGRESLHKLQREIEGALRGRTDLDTPLGARDFQRFLVGKLRDIDGVLAAASLDSTSKADLAAAWATLYGGALDSRSDLALSELTDPDDERFADVRPAAEADESSAKEPLPAPAARTPMPPALPGLTAPSGGGIPGPGTPFGGGVPMGFPLGASRGDADAITRAARRATGASTPRPEDEGLSDDHIDSPPDEADIPEAEVSESAPAETSDPTAVRLPNGETTTAPNPSVAAAVRAAIGGSPIVEAFRQQGMTIPPAGTPVATSLPPDRLLPGDIGVFPTHHALALGNDKALIKGMIEPIPMAAAPGFLGWTHPPAPVDFPLSAQAPAQTRPASATTVSG